jgi:SAM-dependent methyltransferase
MNKKIASHNNNLDRPLTTINRRKVIKKKYFLFNIYKDFYKRINLSLHEDNRKGKVVELGSGAGFIKKIIPNIITSDILKLPQIDMHFSATDMPFKKNSTDAFVMIDVFHHIPDVETFLNEANRCLKKDGQIIMIEPASTFFGKLIFKYFHHETFNENSKWSFKSLGPLSSANSALPWIVFYRDRKKFEKKFPLLKIIKIEPHTPFKYLLSGGFSYPQLLPNSFYKFIDRLEKIISPLNPYLGMFYTIHVQKVK